MLSLVDDKISRMECSCHENVREIVFNLKLVVTSQCNGVFFLKESSHAQEVSCQGGYKEAVLERQLHKRENEKDCSFSSGFNLFPIGKVNIFVCGRECGQVRGCGEVRG